ncbi:NACHT domain-containing protein [Aliarcobacter butzleri]|uniref:NACHT domain-containing protein n=1 Tax=Aliarcobacter butzleri TaxID=28197 RepID=UPI003B21E9C7
MILIDGKKIVEELISGKIIVSIEQAIDNVPKIDGIRLLNDVDLIASNIGWIWVLYFGQNQTTSHFSLIHAEGNPLVAKLAQQIISIDKKLSKKFENLEYISPLEKKDMLSLSKQAKEKYFKYIECECGEIQFEGLPTDKDAGSVKVKLENIFEPLHLERVMDEDNELDIIDIRESFGEVLANNNRLAILAKPGGGKSTLIKRIAVAYAYPEKISLVHDYLPKKEYFPIFIRCRELGEKVKSSITDIIFSISNKAEIEDLKEGFYKIVSDALQNGTALLLIDGLDEISIDRDRIYFVNQLRIFLARYPNISIITTSRKAGFRAVGGILADYCTKYEISNLNQLEIRELSKKWHIAIIDDSKNTIDESNELVNQILADGRITVLAENPLLLTTLLFVKRWAGYLPTKRHILYQEMIKLLLVTWNVEGHEQLDIDETEPQLSFVAYWMSENGKQTITEKELKKCLNDARKQMPDVLGYTNITVSNFIKRVESRSSLLIMSGHKQLEDKSIVPVYEFLHLSFQEYLTAKAVVEKSLPSNLHNETNLNILKPHILKENWKEIIPLVAVLSKRDNKELIKYLIDKSKISANNRKINKNNVQKYSPMLLGNCIANEIQISPELLKEALEWYAKNRYNLNNERVTEIIMNGKFGDTFQEVIEELFFNTYIDEFSSELGGLLGEIFILRLDGDSNCSILKEIQSQIMNKNKKKSCIGISALMSYSFEKTRIKEKEVCDQETYNQFIKGLLEVLLSKLNENDKHYLFLIPWTIAWIYDDKNALINIGISNEWIYKLINIWLDNNEHNIVRVSAWALNEVFNATSDIVNHINLIEDIKNKIQKKYDEPLNEYDKYISIYIGIEIEIAWDKKELKTFFSNDNLRRNLENDRLYKFYIKKLGIRIKKLEEISELTHFE